MRAINWLTLLLVATFATTAQAVDVSDWQNPINYPARVNAVVWSGARLDAHTQVQFGAWTVRFNPQTTYVAEFTSNSGSIPFKLIQIGNDLEAGKALHCANAVAGEMSCDLDFMVSKQPTNCSLKTFRGSGYDHITDIHWLSIPCPSALDLQR